MQGENVTSSSLLLAHAHFAFLFKEFLSANSVLAISPNSNPLRNVNKLERSHSDANANGSDLEVSDVGLRDRVVSLDEDDDNTEQSERRRRERESELMKQDEDSDKGS